MATDIIKEIEEGEDKSIEEVLEELHSDTDELVARLNKVAAALEQKSATPVTYKEVAQLYRFLSGDIAPLIKGVLTTQSALIEVVADEEDEDEDSAESEGIDEDAVNLYIAATTANEAFTQMASLTELSDAQKAQLNRLAALQKASMDYLQEQFGDALLQQASERLKEAGGGDASA